MKNKKNSWLIKWDFNRYNFADIDKDYIISGKTVDINYGNYYIDTKENRIKLKDKPSTEISENDDIFIYFTNIPGASNQIYLKCSELEFKNENGEYYWWKHDDEKSEHKGMLQRYIKPKKIEWVLNYDKPLQFTKEGIINNYNKDKNLSIKERPNIQRILNPKLVDDLNSNLHSYKELVERMKKINICYLTRFYDRPANHEVFTKRQNVPYVEQHHFVIQEKYNKFLKDNNNSEEIEKLKKLVYSPINIILFCPRCHRKIHHGLEEDVIDMINVLLDNKEKLLDNTKEIAKIFNMSYIDLISDMYNIKFVRR